VFDSGFKLGMKIFNFVKQLSPLFEGKNTKFPSNIKQMRSRVAIFEAKLSHVSL